MVMIIHLVYLINEYMILKILVKKSGVWEAMLWEVY